MHNAFFSGTPPRESRSFWEPSSVRTEEGSSVPRKAVAPIRHAVRGRMGNLESFRECDIIRADKVTAKASNAHNVDR